MALGITRNSSGKLTGQAQVGKLRSSREEEITTKKSKTIRSSKLEQTRKIKG